MKLEFNKETERYNDLHSGEMVSIFINEKWKKVRIENDEKGWYFIDEDSFMCRCKRLEGIELKIQ